MLLQFAVSYRQASAIRLRRGTSRLASRGHVSRGVEQSSQDGGLAWSSREIKSGIHLRKVYSLLLP